jgi:hypothetical protein
MAVSFQPSAVSFQPSAVSCQPHKTSNSLGFAERVFELTADG